jgi:predicted Fe-Mo cluster-binding NifX family protein
MRIAIPDWEGKVSPVFDTASRLLVVEVEDQGETSRFEIYLDEQDLSRRCFRMQGMEIDILICGAISRPFLRMLTACGIEVIPEISGLAEEVLQAYLKGNLFHSRFLMPGCKRNRFGQGSRALSGRKSCKQWRDRKGRDREKRT